MANNRHFGSAHSYFGADTKGHDVKMFGDTTGKYVEWDASADQWNIQGSMAQTGNQDITGALTLSGLATLNGGIKVGNSLFTVSTAGATLIKSTLGVGTNATEFTVAADGALAIATNKFTVSAAADLSSYNQEADATGVTWTAKKSRAAGASAVANDVVLDIIAQGMNSTPALKSIAEIQAIITDVVAGTEDGKISFLTMVAGAAAAEKLAITSVVNSVVDLQVNTDKWVFTASSGDVAAKNVEADATGVTLTAKKSRAAGAACSDNDVALSLVAQGTNDNATPALHDLASVDFIMTDASDTTEDGKLSFKTVVNGAALAEKMSIDSAVNLSAALNVGVDDTGYDVKFFGATAGSYLRWDQANDELELIGKVDHDYTGTATRALDFQTIPGAGMTSGVDKQFMYVRADLDRGWDEDVSGGDGYTVGMFRGYIGANAGGMIAVGLRAGMNLDAGVVVSDGAGAGYISGAQITTYVPATANAKCNKGIIIAPRDDTAVAAIAGSQYIGAQIYLAQVVAKQESWGLDIYTESACADLNAAINIRNGGNEKYIYGIDMNGMSTPTADIRFSAAATVLNSAAGALDVALGTIAGTTADNGFAVTVTDSTTFSSGYANAVYLNLTNSGNKTGNFAASQINGFAADITMAGTGNLNGGYIYIAKSGSPNLSTYDVIGWNVDIQEMGATDYLANLQLQKTNTTKGTGVDAFILCSLQSTGVAKSLIHMQGIALPDAFLTITPGSARDMLVAGEPTGTTKRYLKVDIGGAAYSIICNSVA